MITYATLEHISTKTLYQSFLKAFVGFRITSEATHESFCEMLKAHTYDPEISIGAVDSETGELVSFILNSISSNDRKSAYDILTGTIPDYRRQGIAHTIMDQIKELLMKKQVERYTTKVLKSNSCALNFYLLEGFKIKREIVHAIHTPNGDREIEEYEIIMNIKSHG